MKKIVKDGWHKVYGIDVYVECGQVKRGIYNGRIVYPYRKSGCGDWDIDTHMSIPAFRAGLSRGTVTMG